MSAQKLSKAELVFLRGSTQDDLWLRLLDEHVDLRAPTTWRPIETAPMTGERVLLYWAGTDDVHVGCWLGSWPPHCDDNPTHWMLLPEPPP